MDKQYFVQNFILDGDVDSNGFFLVSTENYTFDKEGVRFKYQIVVDVHDEGDSINLLVVPHKGYLTKERLEIVKGETGTYAESFRDLMYSPADVLIAFQSLEDMNIETDYLSDELLVYMFLEGVFDGFKSIESYVHDNLKSGERYFYQDWKQYISGFEGVNVSKE